MNKQKGNADKSAFSLAGLLALTFFVFTLFAKTVDVKPIGPDGSSVGFATINKTVSDIVGTNLFWYNFTDRLGVVAMMYPVAFAVLGLSQLIKRRRMKKVDPSLLLLGAFYLAVIAIYAFFEKVVINYRPLILKSDLEPSYPSSHVMIVICVTATATMQFHRYLRNKSVLLAVTDVLAILIATVTVIGRLISGVHWFTDIVGGAILSSALVTLYHALAKQADTAFGRDRSKMDRLK